MRICRNQEKVEGQPYISGSKLPTHTYLFLGVGPNGTKFWARAKTQSGRGPKWAATKLGRADWTDQMRRAA